MGTCRTLHAAASKAERKKQKYLHLEEENAQSTQSTYKVLTLESGLSLVTFARMFYPILSYQYVISTLYQSTRSVYISHSQGHGHTSTTAEWKCLVLRVALGCTLCFYVQQEYN